MLQPYCAYYQSKHIRATVDSAAVSNLTVQNGTSLSYNLTVRITLYNPSVRVGIYYDSLDANLRLGDADLGPAGDLWIDQTYQHQKTNDIMVVYFAGRNVSITGDTAAELQKDINDKSAVSFQVVIRARVRYKAGAIKTRKKPSIRCPLNIPVKAEGGHGDVAGVLSGGGRCKVKY